MHNMDFGFQIEVIYQNTLNNKKRFTDSYTLTHAHSAHEATHEKWLHKRTTNIHTYYTHFIYTEIVFHSPTKAISKWIESKQKWWKAPNSSSHYVESWNRILVNKLYNLNWRNVNKNKNPLQNFSYTFLGVTILLSLTVFLNLVAETLPQVSDAIPLLGSRRRTYLEIIFLFSFLSFVCFCYSLLGINSSFVLLCFTLNTNKRKKNIQFFDRINFK